MVSSLLPPRPPTPAFSEGQRDSLRDLWFSTLDINHIITGGQVLALTLMLFRTLQMGQMIWEKFKKGKMFKGQTGGWEGCS